MTKYEFTRATIRQFISNPEAYDNGGWFYLPPNEDEWSLDTEGVFSLDGFDFEPDSDEFLPPEAKTGGWIESLDANIVGEVLSYAQQTIDNPTIEQLFDSFVYYYKYDAFLEL